MSRNWLRTCSLQVGGGQIDLGKLRVVFAIEQGHAQSPNMAHFRVYNVSPATQAKLKQPEFTAVKFYGGYQDNSGLLFSGNIKQFIAGHENAVDSYVDLYCADGDQGYIAARVNKTLAAGWTPKDKLQVALDAFKKYGVNMGNNTLDLSQPKFPRGIPLIGMARDVIREVVRSKQGLWSIQNGQIMITPKSLDSGSNQTIKLSASTGLIGWPYQTNDGIISRSLINPNLQPLSVIEMDPSDILAAQRDNNPLSQSGPITNTTLDNQALAAGKYTVYKLNRFGDTRGHDWYDEATSIGSGGSLPPGASDKGYTLNYS